MTKEEKFIEAKRLYETANADQKYVLETLFPELAESEDERIRKELIEYIKDQQSSFISAPDCRDKYEEEENNKYNSWIAWLEKQQKPVITEDKDAEKAAEEYRNFRMSCGIKDPVMLNEIEEAYYEGAIAIRKQKPVIIPKFREGDIIKHKDTDETFEVSKIEVIDANEIYYHLTNGGCICENFDNFERVEQKSVEWSDEDEKMLKETLTFIETVEDINKAKDGFLDVKMWLKSLKERYT